LNLDNGVAKYIYAKATVTVHFPVDFKGNSDINCTQCFFYREASRRCGLTGQIAEYPTKYVASTCPLEIVEAEENEAE